MNKLLNILSDEVLLQLEIVINEQLFALSVISKMQYMEVDKIICEKLNKT